MTLAQVRKAVGGFIASSAGVLAALVTYNILPAESATWVTGLIGAATPLLTFLGVYKAKANVPPPPDPADFSIGISQ